MYAVPRTHLTPQWVQVLLQSLASPWPVPAFAAVTYLEHGSCVIRQHAVHPLEGGQGILQVAHSLADEAQVVDGLCTVSFQADSVHEMGPGLHQIPCLGRHNALHTKKHTR